ncbi:hypothetical protein OSTOST_01703 [Ostertagia ostertagi]
MRESKAPPSSVERLNLQLELVGLIIHCVSAAIAATLIAAERYKFQDTCDIKIELRIILPEADADVWRYTYGRVLQIETHLASVPSDEINTRPTAKTVFNARSDNMYASHLSIIDGCDRCIG